MLNESVKNFLTGDVSGMGFQTAEQTKPGVKIEGQTSEFAEEVKKIMAEMDGSSAEAEEVGKASEAGWNAATVKARDSGKLTPQANTAKTPEVGVVGNSAALAKKNLSVDGNKIVDLSGITAASGDNVSNGGVKNYVDSEETILNTDILSLITMPLSDVATIMDLSGSSASFDICVSNVPNDGAVALTASPDKPVTAADFSQTINVMKSALSVVVKALGLSDTAEFDVKEDMLSFDSESMEQFADIMWGIDTAIKLIEEKINSNPEEFLAAMAENGVSPFAEMKNVGDMLQLLDDLRTAKSRLDIGFSILGLRDIITEKIAANHDVNTVLGITRAANPSDLGMSTSDLARVFAGLIKEDLTSAIGRVKSITSGQVEMTELEKAAIELGTVRSEILKTALNKTNAPSDAAFKNFDTVNAKTNLDSDNVDSVKVDNVSADKPDGSKVKVDNVSEGKNGVEKFGINKIDIDKVDTAIVDKHIVNKSGADKFDSDTTIADKQSVNKNNIDSSNAFRSNINKTNIDKANVSNAFAKVEGKSDTVKADVEIDAKDDMEEVSTKVKATASIVKKAFENDFEFPISVKEAVSRKIRESVETANRKASMSVEQSPAKYSAADTTVEIPVSVKESVNKKTPVNNGTGLNAKAETAAAVKIAAADDTVEIPVSVTEVASSKKTADNGAKQTAKPMASKAEKSAASAAQNSGIRLTDGNVIERKPDTIVSDAAKTDAKEFDSQTYGKFEKTHSNHDVKASAEKSSDSNVMIAGFAEANKVENIAEVETHEQNVARIEVAEFRASQAVEHAEKAATAFSRTDNEAVIRQLTEKMQSAIRSGIHEIRLVLRPESLGEVRMSIRVEGDVVMARMQVENRQVKAIVESNMQSLKDSLEKQNLQFGAFSVDVGTNSDRSPRQAWQEMDEMAEMAGLRRFKPDNEQTEGSLDNREFDPLASASGSDTGRRFGNNTFEYLI